MTDPVVTLDHRSDGVYVARWLQHRYRFMFSDGTTADVESHMDSSTLRGAVLEALGKDRIEGVADLAPPTPAKAEAKKRRAKQAVTSPGRTGKW